MAGNRQPIGPEFSETLIELAWRAGLAVAADHARAAVPHGFAPQPSPQRKLGPVAREGSAQRLWNRAGPVPPDTEHPARRWTTSGGAKPGVWPVDRPWPPGIRWLPAYGGHEGAGSLVAAAAPLEAWLEAWPAVPVARIGAVQLLALTSEG